MSKRHKLRAIAGLTALATVVAAGTQVMPAQATFGTADIKPIESNIAAKFWAKATASSGSSTAKLAIDGDPATSWLADKAGSQRLTVDLGGAYDNLRKVRVLFARPDAVNQYVVEASSDGRRWSRIADDRARSRGAVHLFSRPGTRYVRLTIVGSLANARVAVSEFEVLNYLRDNLVLGADLSWMDDYQNRQYWVDPLAADRGAGPHLLDVAKDRGMEFSRLRIFNEPRSESTGEPTPVPRQGPDRSLQSAQWIKQRNMGLGIDFHYADSWADPSKQPKPRRWAELEFDQLTRSVYDYTAGYLRRLAAQGTVPDKVAVGNEIINGFMYGSEAVIIGTTAPPYFVEQASTYQSKPGGGLLWKYWGSADPVEQRLYNESWDRFTTLAAAGIKAVRDTSPRSKVEIHVIVGTGRLAKTMEFWHQFLTRVKAKGQNPDVLGISYYPQWHGTPEALDVNLHTMATTYPEYELEVAETSYPASGGDGTPLPNSPFPRTVQGQADAIQRVFQAANDVVDNQGSGVLTWEPAGWETMFRAVPELPNTWEPHASINVYNASRAKHILEDTVYNTTVVGATPALPRTIQVLTTASKRIAPVPVRWQPLPPGATDTPGQVTITGTTSRGQVKAVIDVVQRTSAMSLATQASAAPARYEAEAAPATCSGTIDTDHSGYSGTGFCNGANAIGAAAQFTVNAPTSGTATVGIRFASGTATARLADVIVNGSRTAGTTFEGTGAWSTWSTKTLAVQVKAGSNTIALSPTTAAGLPNVDYVDVALTAGGSAGTGRLDDANLQYYGRWNRSNSSFYTMGWAGGYLDARFTGSSIGVRQRNAADLFYSIDGGPVRWRRNVSGNVSLATGLPGGSHSVRIGYRERAGSYNGDPGFGGLILAGGAQTAPVTRPQNLIEFIGDSITVGQPNADRPFVAYPWRTGEALGAAHTQVAEGGACLVSRDCIGMMDWFRRSSSRSTSDDWNFSTYQATGVVINLGTNDIGHGVSAAQFQQGYVVLLERVRRAYPNAHIFAMQTFRNRYVPETRNAVAARTTAGDSNVHFVDTTGWINSTTDLVDAVHPSPTGHAKIAQRLAPVLDQYL